MDKLTFDFRDDIKHTSEVVGITNDQHNKLRDVLSGAVQQLMEELLSIDSPDKIIHPHQEDDEYIYVTPQSIFEQLTNNPAVEAIGFDISNPNHCFWMGYSIASQLDKIKDMTKMLNKTMMLLSLAGVSSDKIRKVGLEMIKEGSTISTVREKLAKILAGKS